MEPKVILLIEDNADDETLALRALKKNNIANQIVVARDGQEALDYLDGSKPFEGVYLLENLALILLDLKLPKVDGLEVLKRIRKSAATQFIPVVVLTSSKEEKDLIESYRLGANSYIQKPVDFERFADALKQLGMYWLVLNEMPKWHGKSNA